MKKAIILLLVVIVGVGAYFLFQSSSDMADVVIDTTPSGDEQTDAVNTGQDEGDVVVIGKSVEGRDITAYHYGSGDKEILFVGGVHGGYSWNTALVAYELMDYLKANPAVIPSQVSATVIPVLNPDGLHKVVGTTTDADRFTRADVSSS